MNKYILYVQNDTGEHCEYDGDMEETEAIHRNPVRTLKERNEAIVESTARYVCMYVVLTFSSWHIPQSGNNNLLDTGLTGQATTRESGRHQNHSPQNIDSLHTACAQELSLLSQTVPTYLRTYLL